MSELILAKTFNHNNRKVNIYYDPEPINPRTDYDNATVMVYWHTREVIGDIKVERCTKEEIMAEYEEKGDKILAILPLNAYIHSGITISTGSFACAWDSGQVGWVFVTESKKALMGFPDDYTTEQYEEVIQQDVKTYDEYLTGEVYGYTVEGRDGTELESCWGFIGDMVNNVEVEAKAAADHSVDPCVQEDADELASRITYASVL